MIVHFPHSDLSLNIWAGLHFQVQGTGALSQDGACTISTGHKTDYNNKSKMSHSSEQEFTQLTLLSKFLIGSIFGCSEDTFGLDYISQILPKCQEKYWFWDDFFFVQKSHDPNIQHMIVIIANMKFIFSRVF